MKKFLKWFGISLGTLLLLVGSFAMYVAIAGIPSYEVKKVDFKAEFTPARFERGKKLVDATCSSCHLNPSTGKFTGKPMPDVPEAFGEIHSRNITQDKTYGIGDWSDADIAYLLRTGVRKNGQYAPPYMIKVPNMSDEDLKSIIVYLRSDDAVVQASAVPSVESSPTFLVKFLSRVAFKPFEYPEKEIPQPDTNDLMAYGKYLATAAYGCYSCHSADFKTNDAMHPEQSVGFFGGGNSLLDASGKEIFAPNLTSDRANGIGSWTEANFIRAVRDGFTPDNKPLRYPMERIPGLDDLELRAMFTYLRSIPPLTNKVDRKRDLAVATAAAMDGKKIYHKYACNSCHGENGVGICDITKACEKYHSNEELTAVIKEPGKFNPGSKMPNWGGVIQEAEFAPLCEYVRFLGNQPTPQRASAMR